MCKKGASKKVVIIFATHLALESNMQGTPLVAQWHDLSVSVRRCWLQFVPHTSLALPAWFTSSSFLCSGEMGWAHQGVQDCRCQLA